MLKEVLEYLPIKIVEEIKEFTKVNKEKSNKIEEIRLRINQKLSLKIENEKQLLTTNITKEIIDEAFENICERSIYSYTNQIAEGFITLKGGNRVGITGTPVIENEKIINIKYISSLNFRIANQIKDISNIFLKYIIDIENDSIFNTLIASPPGCGKTTILKDLTRKISSRNARNQFYIQKRTV